MTPDAAASTVTPSRSAIGAYALSGEGAVESEASPEERRRIEYAGDQHRIGNGRFGPAAAIGGGTWLGAGRNWSDLECTAAIEPGDAAAAGSDLDDIDDRRLDRITGRKRRPLQAVIAGDFDFAAFDQGALGGRSADVQRNDIRFADVLADQCRANDASGGAGLDEMDRMLAARLQTSTCHRWKA